MVKDVSKTNMVQALNEEKMESRREEARELVLEVGMVYHCETEEYAIDFLARLHKLGYTWNDGDSLLECSYWWQYEIVTGYMILEDKKIIYTDISFYSGDEIIEYTAADNLTVEGCLDLSYTTITSLPDNLTVKSWLDLGSTDITSLPNNLTVGGFLNLRHTPITALPDNLTVDGSLYLSNTEITVLPNSLTVEGSLDLSGSKITSLPDNLTVKSYLDLSNTNITTLPNNLTVGGWLDLRETNITSLPDNLKVGGMIYADFRHNKGFSLENGTITDKYIFANFILMHVKKVEKLQDYTVYVSPFEEVCVEKDGVFAHGESVEEALDEIEYMAKELIIIEGEDLC